MPRGYNKKVPDPKTGFNGAYDDSAESCIKGHYPFGIPEITKGPGTTRYLSLRRNNSGVRQPDRRSFPRGC